MSDTIYIVQVENPGSDEPQFRGFIHYEQAKAWANTRGGCEFPSTIQVLDENDASNLIRAEARERAEEERFDRMRDEGRI